MRELIFSDEFKGYYVIKGNEYIGEVYVMRKLDENKLKGLLTADELLSGKYGEPGTESRKQFDSEARAYYCGVILRDRRKELRMTQQELADKVGTNRSYISRIEKGDTDIQLSSFLRIISAMNLSLELHAV